MSLKSFKNISNFRTKKDKMISKTVILHFDFDDVILTDNSLKSINLETMDVTNFKWNCITLSRIIMLNQSTNFGIKALFPSGMQCASIQRNKSIDQDVYINAGEYSLSFYLQKRANFVVNPIQLSIAGTVIFTILTIPEKGKLIAGSTEATGLFGQTGLIGLVLQEQLD